MLAVDAPAAATPETYLRCRDTPLLYAVLLLCLWLLPHLFTVTTPAQPATRSALRAAPGAAAAGSAGAPRGQEAGRQEGLAGGTHSAPGSSSSQRAAACARCSSGARQRSRQQRGRGRGQRAGWQWRGGVWAAGHCAGQGAARAPPGLPAARVLLPGQPGAAVYITARAGGWLHPQQVESVQMPQHSRRQPCGQTPQVLRTLCE